MAAGACPASEPERRGWVGDAGVQVAVGGEEPGGGERGGVGVALRVVQERPVVGRERRVFRSDLVVPGIADHHGSGGNDISVVGVIGSRPMGHCYVAGSGYQYLGLGSLEVTLYPGVLAAAI